MVVNKWRDAVAEKYAAEAGNDPADKRLAQQVYASRLIGSDPDLVLHGGGNTSCKVTRKDLFNADQEIMHVKGSGRDLAQIDAGGMPAMRLAPVRVLRSLANLSDEDMVNTQRSAMLDASAPNPSIESLLHAFLPHAFVNHTHAT
ncbi:MAG: bifunctional aldolase/short-chain dehydrogenase, partial [Rhodobacteraceae bacterium]|nr:bifunctional aldolase/short-chain dehydrogenase [Paracoccaceae bacterium]